MKNHIRNQYTQQKIEFRGKIYNTYTDIHSEYNQNNITIALFLDRIGRGWTIEESLGLVKKNFIEYQGIQYDSYKDLYDNANPEPLVEYYTFMSRRNKGWSINDALYTKNKRINKILYNNHVYTSLKNLYDNEYHTVPYNMFTKLYKTGKYSLQEALLGQTQYKKQNTDCFGNIYSSISEKCKVYNISRSVYENRLKNSYPEMAALGIIPIFSKGNGRSAKKNIKFRPYFYIDSFQYIGIDNKEYWSCVIDEQELILSKEEIYQKMENIVMTEYRQSI